MTRHERTAAGSPWSEDLLLHLRRPARGQSGGGREHNLARGRNARPRRRIGVWQNQHLPVDRRPVAAGGTGRWRRDPSGRYRPRQEERPRDASLARQHHRHDLAGPHGLAKSAIQHLQPGRRARLLPPRHAQPLAAPAGGGAAAGRAHPLASHAHAWLSPPNERRYAPAHCWRQRIVGAIALAGGPKLIIADEPTTNLDVTIQAQYLDLLKDIQQETGVALIFVTHNLGIVARMCDRLAVMYAGRIVEAGTVRQLFDAPQHP